MEKYRVPFNMKNGVLFKQKKISRTRKETGLRGSYALKFNDSTPWMKKGVSHTHGQRSKYINHPISFAEPVLHKMDI
jgi:hypothetical protein